MRPRFRSVLLVVFVLIGVPAAVTACAPGGAGRGDRSEEEDDEGRSNRSGERDDGGEGGGEDRNGENGGGEDGGGEDGGDEENRKRRKR